MPEQERLLELSQYRSDEQPVMSLYLRGYPNSIEGKHLIHLKNLLSEAEEQSDQYSNEVWERVQEDLEAINSWVQENYPSSSKNTVFFACGEELWHIFTPSTELPNQITLSDRPDLRAFYELLPRADAYLVLLADARNGRIFIVTADETTEVTQIERTVEENHSHSQGGWAQATLQRHHEKMVAQHLQEITDSAFSLWQEQEFNGVLLMGTDERTSELENHLHSYLKENLLGRIPMDMQASEEEIAEAALECAHNKRREQEDEQISLWQAHLASENGLGVEGLANTLQAVQMGQLQTLFMRADWQAPGGKCERCGILSAQESGNCKYCAGEISHQPDITDDLIANALSHNAQLIILPADNEEITSNVGAIRHYAIR